VYCLHFRKLGITNKLLWRDHLDVGEAAIQGNFSS
jgi:hypothetical protein